MFFPHSWWVRTPSAPRFPYLFPGTKWFDQKLPTIRIDGFSTFEEGPYPGTWSGFVYAWSNNTTKIIQNHTLKWGVFLERSGQNDHIQFTTSSPPATHNENGMFRFLDSGNPNTTGLAMANAALGNFNEYAELGGKPITPWVATAFDWFVQDSWKATRKLTIEAGVPLDLAALAQPLEQPGDVSSRLLRPQQGSGRRPHRRVHRQRRSVQRHRLSRQRRPRSRGGAFPGPAHGRVRPPLPWLARGFRADAQDGVSASSGDRIRDEPQDRDPRRRWSIRQPHGDQPRHCARGQRSLPAPATGHQRLGGCSG